MKDNKRASALKSGVVFLLLVCVTLLFAACSQQLHMEIQGELQDNTVIEYTGEKIQFPLGYVADQNGRIVSYGVEYEVIKLADNSSVKDEYATFDLKTGDYQLLYTYKENPKIQKKINFSIQDTTCPTVEFLDVPNGLFLQDITEDTINKLPLYSIEDASTAEGIDLQCVLKFKGEGDADFKEHPYRQINNSYVVESFGTFSYELTATDIYGNQTVAIAQWKVKDRDWKPAEQPADGILADYSSEGYCNLVESGDANQYYKIGNDYKDSWLEEFEGAQGVLKIELPFNNAVGWGNNTIRLRTAKTFTQEDLEGKYLAVRIYVEGEHLKDSFLFAGNNVQFWAEDATTRAFTTGVTGLKTGQWMTFYIEGAMAEHIGIYPNATYNSDTTFYEGGDPADALQLCFHREAGYFNDMTLYVDSISIAEILPDTAITVSGKEASWTAVEGAAGYLVNLNGEESVIQETTIALPGEKGYIRVTPLGNGVTTLDAQTVTGVYGLDAGDSLAKFDDPLYIDLFTDQLKFSTVAEHNGYRPQSLEGTLTSEGLTMNIGTGSWGVVTGIRFQFPQAQEKGDNTTLILNMLVSHADYGKNIRVYDYNGVSLGTIEIPEEAIGQYYAYEIDLSAYDRKIEGIQLIFGPNETFTSVPGGVSVSFKEIRLENTYYPITVDGQSLMCAGTRKLTPHYTTKDLVQFASVYNFGVTYDDAPLNFSGTVLLDGKELKSSAISVVGYPNSDTICFKVVHGGKILTIMKDSVIYWGGIAVKVEETFNAKWDGSSWVAVDTIPDAPAPEYVTLKDGSVKTVENKTALETGYTAKGVVQFLNVNDFGVTADDTPLNFEGTVMLDGEVLRNPTFVGYPGNTTITLKAPHQGKVLTILKGAVIYYGDKAVVVTETFNAKWNGSGWVSVSQIPEIPETQYVTLSDGIRRELVATVELTAGYTENQLMQFTDVYDLGCPEDSTPIGFEGTVLLQGTEVKNPLVEGYLNSTTVGIRNINHKGKVVTVMEGAYFYNDTAAVKVKTTFNALWDGEKWTAVEEIPEPPAKEYITVDGEQKELVGRVTLQAAYTASGAVQFADVYDFGAAADDTPLGFEGTVLLDGKEQKLVFVGYPNNTTIALKANHQGKVVTILKDSVIYNDGYAVIVAETFNALWDGEKWTAVEEIPEPPAKEYIAVNGEQKELVGRVTLQAAYTASGAVQFADVYDFGAAADDTPLGFEGTVLLDGKEQKPVFVGYPNNTTIALKANHQGKVVTILKDSIIYNEDYAVIVAETFNALWDGEKWTAVEEIPEPPAKEYISVNGVELELVGTVELTAGYTENKLIQFTDIYDFGCPEDSIPIGFEGTVLLQGTEVKNPLVEGYLNSTTVGIRNINHKGKVVTVMEGSVFHNDTAAVKVAKTFNAMWDGTVWTAVAEIPEPEEPEVIESLAFTYRYGTADLIQVNTNLPANTPLVNFTTADNGCQIDESANRYQNVGWIGMEEVDGTIVLSFHFNAGFTAGQTYLLPEGALFAFTDGSSYPLDKDYSFLFDGTAWSLTEKEPETTEPPVTEPGDSSLSFTYRYGTADLIQVNTDLPVTTPIANFTLQDNGCSVDESVNTVQWAGWVGMENVNGTVVLTFHYNSPFTAGQQYILPAGAVFGFTDGSRYELDKDYIFTFNGTDWSMAAEEPGETEPTEPETTGPEATQPGENILSFTYRYGTADLIQVNTDLPVTTPIANFTLQDNGCSVDESVNTVQWAGWVGMENVNGTVLLTFHYNSPFTAGQQYILPAGAVFGFTDGSRYELDKDYIFTFNGTDWSMAAEEPGETEPTEPELTEPETTEPPATEPGSNSLGFELRGGTGTFFQVNTNLPDSTPLKDFLTSDNGCSIDETANRYKNVGYISMASADGTIVLTFNFNSAFEAGQTYVLPAGAVFGFTDGNKYELDQDYTFTFNGTGWSMAAEEPGEMETTEPEATEPETTVPGDNSLSFTYRYGTADLIQVNTDLPDTTPCVSFTASDNGCDIDESGNTVQWFGWAGMENVSGTVVITFHFNSAFTAGQTYVLPAGAVFGFTDGSKYELDQDYTFTFNGTGWSMAAEEPDEEETTEPEATEPETTEPEVTEPEATEPEVTEPELPALSLSYRFGNGKILQLNTDLPADIPRQAFTTADNGCDIDESAGAQAVNKIMMSKSGDTIILAFSFSQSFTAGQTYVLPAGSVFGFTDGSKYELDKDYTFTYDGSAWSMVATEPEEEQFLHFTYRYGNASAIQVDTDLPADTPCVNFLTGDNGCSIDESANQYYQVSWIAMEKVDETIVLTFTFYEKTFAAGQTYFLPGGSVFGFTDGSKYTLDKDYTFRFDGTNWRIV